MKEAARVAESAGTLGTLLGKLFQRLSPWRRSTQQHRYRRQRRLDGRCRGELAGRIFPSLADQKVLLIGAGEMIELSATHFAAQRPRGMAVATERWTGPGACAPLQRGVDRAARSPGAPARIRYRRVLHRELSADHRKGNDGAHGARPPPPSDIHGRSRRPTRHRSRGCGNGRRLSLYDRRSRGHGARGHRRAPVGRSRRPR